MLGHTDIGQYSNQRSKSSSGTWEFVRNATDWDSPVKSEPMKWVQQFVIQMHTKTMRTCPRGCGGTRDKFCLLHNSPGYANE